MKATEHPQYQQEQEYLTQTLSAIEGELQNISIPPHITTPEHTRNAEMRDNLKRATELKEARNKAYFGRVDWLPEGEDQSETFYIGNVYLPERHVYSWQGTLPGDVYYKGSSEREPGRRLLKRAFQIVQDDLQEIIDEYVAPELEDELSTPQFADSLLLKLLRETRGSKLQDIVATIQAQQYRIITSPLDQLLVIQGAPGSGKTSIALHRVSYLLYHHREELKNVLILGPNKLFLAYTAAVLPILGERRIPQRTFDEWMIDMLGDSLNYEHQHESLDMLLETPINPSEKAMQFRNAKNKGSLKMAGLIDRYVDMLQDDVLQGLPPLKIHYTRMGISGKTISIERTVEQIGTILNQIHHLPLNQRRNTVERQLVEEVRKEIETELLQLHGGRIRYTPDEWSKLYGMIRVDVQKQVRAYFNDWRALNVSVAYRRLLRTSALHQAGQGLFSPENLELMALDAPTARTPFRFSDLAALMYLKIRLDGTDGKTYDHIVIDEAQDITPLHFKVLCAYSKDVSMTILGDLSQNIYVQHGIQDWQQIAEAVGTEQIITETVQQSYRSTEPIITFANAMLQRIGLGTERLSDPVARPGPEPDISTFQDRTAFIQQVIGQIHQAHEAGHHSIGIICKTVSSCRTLATELDAAGFNQYQLIDNTDTPYQGETTIIPTYLTKGLEFDTIILTDADSETYPPDMLHTNLLYVAITRAAHTLHIHHIGTISPMLDHTIASIEIPALLNWLKHRHITIEDYAISPGFETDWCVERLATSEKLFLLTEEGAMDETVLDILIHRTKSVQSQASGEQQVIHTITPPVQEEIRWQLGRLSASDSPNVQEALNLIALAFGLFRNHMRQYGLLTSEQEPDTPDKQVVLLAMLLDASNRNELLLSAGRWTTEQRVLQAVDERQMTGAAVILETLISYGIVETTIAGGRSQIRVNQEWMNPLLSLSLGYTHERWNQDQDLLSKIARLPEPVRWEAAAE